MIKFLDWFEIQLPDFLDNQYGEFLILLVLWILIGVVIMLGIRPIIHSIFAKTKTDVDDKILKIIDAPLIGLIFFYGAVQSMRVLDVVPYDVQRSIATLYGVVASLVVVYLAYRIFRAVFIPLGSEFMKRRDTAIEKTVLPFVDKIGGAVIIILGFFWVLTGMGVDITVFLAGIGVAGLVLAFALQDTLSNYFSGLHLMLDRPFEVGDTVQIGEDFMEVLGIGFRSTRLYNIFNHEVVIMPNNMIANQMVINLTQPDIEHRLGIEVGVAYGSPVQMVKGILLEAVTAQKDDVILDNPDKKPVVRFKDFGDSALGFSVVFFVKDVLEQWRVTTTVREHIDRRFREEGIMIPFPQRTLSFLGQEPGEGLKVHSTLGPAESRPGPSTQ